MNIGKLNIILCNALNAKTANKAFKLLQTAEGLLWDYYDENPDRHRSHSLYAKYRRVLDYWRDQSPMCFSLDIWAQQRREVVYFFGDLRDKSPDYFDLITKTYYREI